MTHQYRTKFASTLEACDHRSRLLVTTRDAGLATAIGCEELPLAALDDQSALQLLAQWSNNTPENLPSVAHQIADECGRLPFALACCGAMRRDGIPWTDLLAALQAADLAFLEATFPAYPHPTVSQCLTVSLDALARTAPELVQLYRDLAVFPVNVIPQAAVLTLWSRRGVDQRQAQKALSTLHRKAFLQYRTTAQNAVLCCTISGMLTCRPRLATRAS